MQTNYYFLRQLTVKLNEEISGLVLAECFSQEKDELVMGFCTDGKQWRKKRSFYIRASVRPDFVCLSFPEDFRRASKNSVDLFKPLADLTVRGVRQYLNERCLAIEFEQGYSLLFKLHGNRSNLVLFQEDTVLELLHNKLLSDWQLSLENLDRPLAQRYADFLENGLRNTFPTFGKEVGSWLRQRGFEQQSTEGQWTLIIDVLKQLETPQYFLKTIDYQPTMLLLEEGGVLLQRSDSPIEAANSFFYAFQKVNVFDKEKGKVIRSLQKQIDKNNQLLDQGFEKYSELETHSRYEEWGHILMANLHQIPERADSVTLHNFYTDSPIQIKLKADLSPQKNAENYYRKAKNVKIEIQYLADQMQVREQVLAEIKAHLVALEAIDSLKVLRKYVKEHQLEKPEKQASPIHEQFRRIDYEGFEIYVGRNAKNNDLLTQKFARKEDLWLHARDVTGSHVVVRQRPGRPFPKTVVERAAALAAFYSKRKNDTLCPVIVTPKKYVRKTRDLAEGQVIVDKEEVVMVEPMS
jgi:predicted ribosome quality control (RQC) complex YloA/Tae2 family protein